MKKSRLTVMLAPCFAIKSALVFSLNVVKSFSSLNIQYFFCELYGNILATRIIKRKKKKCESWLIVELNNVNCLLLKAYKRKNWASSTITRRPSN